MKIRALVSASGLLLLLLATTGVKGCREETARTFNPNRAPDTYLTSAPVESTSASYLYHMFWNGTDPDGEVVGFYIAVTDSNIEPHPDSLTWTTRTDTNIAFKVAGTTQTLSHRFYVTAVDNEGREDPTPAWVFFEAFDRFFPEPVFVEAFATEYRKDGTVNLFAMSDENSQDGIRDTIPIVDPLGSDSVVVYFRWTGIDRDRFGSVTGYRYRISGDPGYTDVMGVDTMSASYKNLPSGPQAFAVAALDDAGAQTDPDSVRVFVSNFDPTTRFADTFIERRPTGEGTLRIVQGRGDTVAIGSTLEFTVFGSDRDGDDSKIQYSYNLVSRKACGGGSVPPFSFFDERNTGPVYNYQITLSKDPTESGRLRARARTKDEHDRINGNAAEFLFYSNLPPTVSLGDIHLNDVTMLSPSVVAPGGAISVVIEGARDPDAGNGTGELEAKVSLTRAGFAVATEWEVLPATLVLSGIGGSGSYTIQVQIRDEGCRVLTIRKTIEVIL